MAITKCKMTRSQTRSISKDGRAATVEYRLWYGTVDEAEAYIAANAPATKTTHDSVVMDIESVEVRSDPADERIHTATLDYSSAPRRELLDIGDEDVSFDLSSQTIKVSHSLSTVSSHPLSGETAPNFQQGIGYDGEKYEGADRYVELFSFTVTKVHAVTEITNAFISNLRNAAFRWNAEPFRGQAAGEALLCGASGSKRDKKAYPISYKFLCSSNATGLTLGGISGIDKQGWDHIWRLTQKVNDTSGKMLTPRTKAIYVERLYTSVDFIASLGLAAGT